ncbi:MAG TPA: insulinase family protein [Kofleriaceae bacterium]|nr:insulinase family protein [Kofleriaceae bacterium]
MRRTSLVCLVLLWASCAPGMRNPNFGTLDRNERPFEFEHNIELLEVSNGLKVALIHDERTNLATVDVRYDVGAAEDPAGRAGLAHLVEHLMFEVRGTAGGPTLGEELGEVALYHNAWTSWDYTHYTSHVAIEHLQKAVALEARRLRFRCEDLDDATFEREREVVRAEGREGTSPMADAFLGILGEIYGKDHPYARAITTDEIATVTRDEVCAFVEQYYTPDRAYLVITGPYEPAKISALVGRVFGAIPTKASAPRVTIRGPALDGRVTSHTAPVTRPTALVFLQHPAWGADGTVKFSVGQRGLADGLAKADDEHDWITGTSVWVAGGQRAPVMVATVEVKDASKLRAAADEVFRRTNQLLDGTTREDFSSALGRMTMEYVESWDDLPSRGRWITDFMQYTDHNWFMLKEMRAITDTPWGVAVAQLRGAMTRDRSHVVLLTPSKAVRRAPAAAVPSGSHNLTPWRAPVDVAQADHPAIIEGGAVNATVEEYTLPNGLRVQLAPDPDSPIVDARLIFPVGSAHEPRDRPYLATAAARLLVPYADHRYTRSTFDKLSWSMSHGTEVTESVGETATVISARGLAQWGDWHVWHLSYLLDRGDYDKELLDLIHKLARDRGESEDDEVDPVGQKFLSFLFGAGHPYALPEADRAEAFLRIQHRDLVKWRDDHFRVNGATLIVSGRFDLTAMTTEIEQLFGPLPATAPAPLPEIPHPTPAKGPSWLAVEDTRAVQTSIIIGYSSPSAPGQDEAQHAVLEEMIDDALRDVREGMGASYGVQASYLEMPSGTVLFVKGDVDETKADAVLPYILGRLEAIRAGGDDQRAAFVRARKKVLAAAMGKSGGATAIASQLAAHAAGGHSKSHGEIIASRIAGLTLADVTRVAAADLADVRRVVLVRGKQASVDAAYVAVNATPERMRATEHEGKDADDPDEGDDPDDADEPAPADETSPTGDPDVAGDDGRPHRDADGPRLSVGLPDGELGSDEFGLYYGTTKLTLDEFLDTAGASDVKRRMETRKWMRRGMLGAGALGAAITGVMLLTLDDCDHIGGTADRVECQDRVSTQKSRAVVFFGVSAVLAATGATIGSGVPDNDELRRIATRYNQVVVAPEVTDKGAGLVLSGRF